ncbi:hypothetical protein AYO47_07490 [Planctomyces sp. SCGC AG-212-M04]|nr:hypothetical protein AYO47_07490 [Planctomyces sp. SCGC AG-212-M04]
MVFMVAGLILLLAMVMMSVDVATMQLSRTELRAATDAAAKAGAEALLRTQSQTEAVKAALAFAELNNVGGKAFKIGSQDVVVGTSVYQTDGSWAFSAGGSKPNAVRVNSHMETGSASGPITLAFGKVFKSGNFAPAKTSTASAMTQEICLAIDRSASMAFDLSGVEWEYPNGGDFLKRPKKSSRWDSLLTAVGLYLDEVEDTAVSSRVALVTWGSFVTDIIPTGLKKDKKDKNDVDYSKKKKFKEKAAKDSDSTGTGSGVDQALAPVMASLDAALTLDYDAIVGKLMQRTDFPILGSTNMSAGIDKGVEVLTSSSARPYAQKTLILMTDGQWNEGRSPILAAEDARDKGVMIHVVTFLPDAVSSDAQMVASITGGLYIHANNEAELVAAFEKLARTLPVVLTN